MAKFRESKTTKISEFTVMLKILEIFSRFVQYAKCLLCFPATNVVYFFLSAANVVRMTKPHGTVFSLSEIEKVELSFIVALKENFY